MPHLRRVCISGPILARTFIGGIYCRTYLCLIFMTLFDPVGHCGPPLPCNVVKLVDVPEMDYYAKDNKGEVSWVFSES